MSINQHEYFNKAISSNLNQKTTFANIIHGM